MKSAKTLSPSQSLRACRIPPWNNALRTRCDQGRVSSARTLACDPDAPSLLMLAAHTQRLRLAGLRMSDNVKQAHQHKRYTTARMGFKCAGLTACVVEEIGARIYQKTKD